MGSVVKTTSSFLEECILKVREKFMVKNRTCMKVVIKIKSTSTFSSVFTPNLKKCTNENKVYSVCSTQNEHSVYTFFSGLSSLLYVVCMIYNLTSNSFQRERKETIKVTPKVKYHVQTE